MKEMMKMKHYETIVKAALLGGAAVLLFAGCMKESAINEKYRPAGTPIVFSAATGYENGDGTRTEYSGQLYGNSPKHERIDWVVDDPVTIVYAHGTGSPVTSQYAVTGVSGDIDRNSTASVEVAEGQQKLTWGEGEGDHTFYAMYPSNGFGGNTSASLTNNYVQGSIPAVQTLHVKDGKYLPPMEYGYMVAYKQITSGSTESRVSLPFTPAVTAFEFKLQQKENDTGIQKVTGVELSATTPLTGTFAFDIIGGNDNGATWSTTIDTDGTTVTNTGNTVSFTFPVEGGVSLPAYGGETYLDFTVFALPVEQTGLQLKLIYADDSFKTLALNDTPSNTPHVFEAAKKHVITNRTVPNPGFEYVLEHTGTTITLDDGTVVQEVVREYDTAGATNTAPFASYQTPDGGTTQTSVPVTFEYAESDADGLPVRDATTGEIVWSSTIPSGLSSVSAPLTDPGAGTFSTNVSEYSPGVVKETVSDFLKHCENLQSRVAVGSEDTPYDLSMHDIHGQDRYNQPVTANCYIVDRAGWYMFPIVYGNAIDYTKANASGMAGVLYNKGVNVYAYKEKENPSQNTNTFWSCLSNFSGSAIRTPYVLDDVQVIIGSLSLSDDVEAVVVWQDVDSPEYSFIENVEVTDIPSSEVFYDPINSEYKTITPYIKFRVPEGCINSDMTKDPFHRVKGVRQGNALIALRLKDTKTVNEMVYEAGTILWSWHIWITDGFDSDGDKKGDGFASIPVTNKKGIISNVFPLNLGWRDSFRKVSYKDRVWYVRVSQTSSSVKPIIMRVVQKKANDYEYSAGTYYQRGRKDPFIPGIRTSFTGNPNWLALNCFKAFSPDDEYDLFEQISYSSNIFDDISPSTVADVSASIQNPNIFYSNKQLSYAEWIGTDAFIPHSFWNMSSRSVIGDIAISKTVYDPCPPGYSIPRLEAFSGICGSDFNAYVEDRNGDRVINSEDFENGWYFYTNSSKEQTIFFPADGVLSDRSGALSSVGEFGIYYTYGRYMNTTQINGVFYFTRNMVHSTETYGTAGEASGFSVRPIEEQY